MPNMKLLAVLRRVFERTTFHVLHDGVGLLFLLDSRCLEGLTQLEGVTQPYEAPESPDLRIDTSLMSSSDAAQLVLRLLEERQFIKD